MLRRKKSKNHKSLWFMMVEGLWPTALLCSSVFLLFCLWLIMLLECSGECYYWVAWVLGCYLEQNGIEQEMSNWSFWGGLGGHWFRISLLPRHREWFLWATNQSGGWALMVWMEKSQMQRVPGLGKNCSMPQRRSQGCTRLQMLG